jgi:diacylglycerol kinase (ATP)
MSLHETVIISANPKSGPRTRLALIEQLKCDIESIGYACELHTDLNEMARRARELSQDNRLRTVVAAGGDGTAAIVSSLIDEQIPLTLFPTGSENLLAKYLGVTANSESCAGAIKQLRTRSLDTMEINGKIALLMASIGFDAEVVRRVHQARRAHVTRWSYWKAIVATILAYRWPVLNIVLRDDQGCVMEETQGSWVFIFNVPKYAAGLVIMDDAQENDGVLDVGVLAPGGLIQGIGDYVAVLRRKHQQSRRWQRFRAASVEISLPEKSQGQASCQSDGDWTSSLPVLIRILPTKRLFVV